MYHIITAALTLLLIFAPGPAQAQSKKPEVIPNSFIVVVKHGVNAEVVGRDMVRQFGGTVKHVYKNSVRGLAFHAPVWVVETDLASDPRVAFVEPDYVVHIPPFRQSKRPPGSGGGGTGEGPTSQTTPPGMTRIGLTNLSAAAAVAPNVRVAVLDTGIDLDHPDLNVLGGVDCTGGRGPDDKNGHGTHVAGTIGAINNNLGVVGVAPGAGLYAVKVLGNSGSGSISDIIAGIDWVTARANTISVANMSLSGTGKSNAFRLALQSAEAAGVLYVVAAGNSSKDIYGSNLLFDGAIDDSGGDDVIPAAYPEVAAISAMNFSDDTFAYFSNYSFAGRIDLAAPGVNILSTWKGATYNTISGTSMASPHVAGAAALYIAVHGRSTPAQVRAALIALAEDNWNTGTSPDGIDEKLVNVRSLN